MIPQPCTLVFVSKGLAPAQASGGDRLGPRHGLLLPFAAATALVLWSWRLLRRHVVLGVALTADSEFLFYFLGWSWRQS